MKTELIELVFSRLFHDLITWSSAALSGSAWLWQQEEERDSPEDAACNVYLKELGAVCRVCSRLPTGAGVAII